MNISPISILVTAIVGVILLMVFISYMECTSRSEALEIKYRWGFFSGCNVQHPSGIWVPIRNYRAALD